MTVTDTHAPTEATSPATGGAVLAPPSETRGLAGLLGTGDHKAIGRLWIGTSFLFLVVAGIAGAVVGVERTDVSGIDVVDADVFAQTFSIHSVAGVFLFLVPLLIGLGTYVVPLQVGSPAIAFPRAAAAAYWSYLVAGGVLIASYIGDGGPFGGDPRAVELFIASLVAVLAALTLATISVATTALALRTPGMGLHRIPLFSWSNVVAAGLWVLTLPVIAGLLVLVYVDHRYGPGTEGTFLGGTGQVYLRIAWAFTQPTVYAFAIPALGIIGDIVPVAARTRLTLHRVAMGAIGAFGIFSFGAWAMPGFTPGNRAEVPLEYVGEVPYIGFAVLVLLPLLALTGLLADTVRRGSVRLMSPLVWGLSAVVMLLAGAANGLLVSIEQLDLTNTTAQSAQTHYVVLAVVLAAFGGLVYWSTKLWGGAVPEGASLALAALGLLATILLALPDLITGFLGQAIRVGGATDSIGTIEALNIVSLVGGALLILVALGMVALVAKAAAGRRETLEDPWEGHTLEWATTSPPAVGNFTDLPAVTSEAPLYDARHGVITTGREGETVS